ncbi:hypothetical protein B0T25DRAFT_181657 [Lasiosphaeria hispida]|uniref:Uncharacterized protein n=1 Tax=Lasiosphaeria hispida TaxID=260671 RepID=A0AAJ0HGN6_9PEZI|nr:hypothetical protein B0T25DRAFT_181657 [Lasiosphaeria hispida]
MPHQKTKRPIARMSTTKSAEIGNRLGNAQLPPTLPRYQRSHEIRYPYRLASCLRRHLGLKHPTRELHTTNTIFNTPASKSASAHLCLHLRASSSTQSNALPRRLGSRLGACALSRGPRHLSREDSKWKCEYMRNDRDCVNWRVNKPFRGTFHMSCQPNSVPRATDSCSLNTWGSSIVALGSNKHRRLGFALYRRLFVFGSDCAFVVVFFLILASLSAGCVVCCCVKISRVEMSGIEAETSVIGLDG